MSAPCCSVPLAVIPCLIWLFFNCTLPPCTVCVLQVQKFVFTKELSMQTWRFGKARIAENAFALTASFGAITLSVQKPIASSLTNPVVTVAKYAVQSKLLTQMVVSICSFSLMHNVGILNEIMRYKNVGHTSNL